MEYAPSFLTIGKIMRSATHENTPPPPSHPLQLISFLLSQEVVAFLLLSSFFCSFQTFHTFISTSESQTGFVSISALRGVVSRGGLIITEDINNLWVFDGGHEVDKKITNTSLEKKGTNIRCLISCNCQLAR